VIVRDKEKLNLYMAEWRSKNAATWKPYQRSNQLLRKFGLTIEQYEGMKEKQQNKCAICGSSSTGNGKDWCVDHSHTTNKVRGLLCNSCNLIIGHANDNVDILEKAIAYLVEMEK